jgi:hypothetical protein
MKHTIAFSRLVGGSDVNTLDILLFSGKGKFSSLIQCCSGTQYSHIGLVITGGDLFRIGIKVKKELMDRNGLYIFHSNKGAIGDAVDIITGEEKSGSQINSLTDVVERYNGKVFYRKLTDATKPGERARSTQLNYPNLRASVNALKDKDYETDYLQMCCALFPFSCFGADTSELFCSELVAQVYMDMGIMRKDRESDNYIPSDFSEQWENIRLKKNWKLETELAVVKRSS